MKNNLQHSVSLIAMTAGKMSKNPSLKKLTLLPTGSRPDKNLSGKNGHKPQLHQLGAVTASVNTIRTQSEGGTIEEEQKIKRLENFVKKKQQMDLQIVKHTKKV